MAQSDPEHDLPLIARSGWIYTLREWPDFVRWQRRKAGAVAP